jgi:hypothetical protein
MTSRVTLNFRWQRYPGDRAMCPIPVRTSRDRVNTVSFFGTLQAAAEIHLCPRLRFGHRNKRLKDESFVTKERFS